MSWVLWAPGLAAAAVVALIARRRSHERRIRELGDALERPAADDVFRPETTAGLPDPARRFLARAIEPGTPLARSVRLRMSGGIRLDRDGDARPMTADEILTAGEGYVWRGDVEMGPLKIRGHDAFGRDTAEMRWWLAGLVPVVRAEGGDLARSAAGRLLGETCLFLPSALLPALGGRWEAVDGSTARVRLAARGEETEVTIEVDGEGRLLRLSYPRWNADPANGPVGYLPFVSENFGGERTFAGYTIPTRFRAGWRLGEEGAFPFFFPVIEDAEYPATGRL